MEHRGLRLVDAAVFEPVPFRAAIADGCTHVLALCTRPPYMCARCEGSWFMLGRAMVAVFLLTIQKGGWTRLAGRCCGAFTWGRVLLLACSVIGAVYLWQAGAADQDGGRLHDHRHQARRDEPRVHARRLGAGGREHRDLWRDRGGHAGARIYLAHAVRMPCFTCMLCVQGVPHLVLAGANILGFSRQQMALSAKWWDCMLRSTRGVLLPCTYDLGVMRRRADRGAEP